MTDGWTQKLSTCSRDAARATRPLMKAAFGRRMIRGVNAKNAARRLFDANFQGREWQAWRGPLTAELERGEREVDEEF